ncbi:unnamed protein product [Rotaria magnacalcarata]|uniref:Ion transport domain-containing protein n=3 Tax=Rotaria magnacalcarata TaxID=392030 RepID=A0A816QB39_9BILA|nr:unnamed protein product [Rotaria magnacalcarata]CAF2057478.1 unnamed protein product [Rotaria magnacalcarata]
MLIGLFEKALNRKQTDFVKLFLDHDFPLTNLYRDQSKLLSLYKNSMENPCEIQGEKDYPLLAIYEHILQPSMGDFFDVDVALNAIKRPYHTHFSIQKMSARCPRCIPCGRSRQCQNEASSEAANTSPMEGDSEFHMDVDKELFLWSVITDRHELNLLFWARCKNKICAALVAALVYRKYAHENSDNGYRQKADDFEGLAVEILERFHQNDSDLCVKAIIRQIPAYGNATWLDLAITANAKTFIAHRAVQDVLDNIWFGYIDRKQSHLTIILSTLMPLYSGFLHYHDEIVKTIGKTTFLDKLLANSKFSQQNHSTKRRRSIEKESDDVDSVLITDVTIEESRFSGFKPVGCFEKTTNGIKIYFSNILKFLGAPCVKYLYSLYCHAAFLLLFSYLLLCDFFPLYDIGIDTCIPYNDDKDVENSTKTSSVYNNETEIKTKVPYGLRKHDQPAIEEYILFIWVSTLLCEELRQIFTQEVPSISKKISTYFSAFWNKLDILAIFLFYLGFALRFLPSAECFCVARIVFSVDLTLWFIRSLDIFAAIKRLGPKLVMIGKMVNDLKSFMLMLTIFILGFGVCFHSLIYGTKEFSWHLPRGIISLAYWQMFGDLKTFDLFDKNYQINGYALFILLIVYMAIVSVLLVNLLIAMLSNIFDRLHTNTDQIWKSQRYELICEYLSRPSLPPPLILLSHVWRLVLYTLLKCVSSQCMKEIYDQHITRTTYKIEHNEKLASAIEKAEDAYTDDYFNYSKLNEQLSKQHEIDEEPIHSSQEVMLKKIQILDSQVQVIRDQVKATRDEQNQMLSYLDCIMEGIKNMGGADVRMPKRRHVEEDDPSDETLNSDYYSRPEVQRDSSFDEIPQPTVAPSHEPSSIARHCYVPLGT